jgi:ribosomal protein L5
MSQNINDSNEKMKRIDIEKIVINIGVGKSGDPFERAKMALTDLTGQKRLLGILGYTKGNQLVQW